jgi:hypothetical protein
MPVSTATPDGNGHVRLERYFRDSRAASVMAPVSDALWDFIGKAVCGMPLFE